jgi:hypothetical protein
MDCRVKIEGALAAVAKKRRFGGADIFLELGERLMDGHGWLLSKCVEREMRPIRLSRFDERQNSAGS